MYRSLISLSMLVMLGAAQTQVTDSDPVPMPLDRAADSYAIYSILLERHLKEIHRTSSYWLVADTTTLEKRPNWPCRHVVPVKKPSVLVDPPATFDLSNVEFGFDDPHNATPPVGRKAELVEVLADFDLHCHESVILRADVFQTAIPVYLYKPLQRFTDFPVGAASIVNFSEVYFDAEHTRALVREEYNCGDGCGAARGWEFLEREDGHWKLLKGFLGYVNISP